MAKTKINTGEVPKDMDTDVDIPDTDDMDSEDADNDGIDEGESLKLNGDDEKVAQMDKGELKDAIREVQLEDRLKYTVECRSVEECQMIIKLAQQRIEELKKKGDDKSQMKLTGY